MRFWPASRSPVIGAAVPPLDDQHMTKARQDRRDPVGLPRLPKADLPASQLVRQRDPLDRQVVLGLKKPPAVRVDVGKHHRHGDH